jgi:hypothetical protein
MSTETLDLSEVFPTTSLYTGFVAEVRGVFWDRAAWVWRAQDGLGNHAESSTWSEAQAVLDAMPPMSEGYRATVTVKWDDGFYNYMGFKRVKPARKRKGKRK